MNVIKKPWGEKVVIPYIDLIPPCDRFCEVCLTKDIKVLTGHHIHERKNGGTDDLENLMCLCYLCHNSVHDKDRGEEQLARYRIYCHKLNFRKLRTVQVRVEDEIKELRKKI